MKQSFETSVTTFDVFEPISEILDSVSVVHKSGVNQPSIEVIKAIIRFQRDGLFELSQGIIDLVEHHHAIAPICIVLRVFVIESDRCAEIVHSFLVVADCHKGLASFGVVAGVGDAFVSVGCGLQIGDGFAEALYGLFSIGFVFVFGELSKQCSSFVVLFYGLFLLLDLVLVVGIFIVFGLWLLHVIALHRFISIY